MIELVELSDLAWTIVDAVGEHESIEQAWTAALPDDWAPAEGVEALRVRLDEVRDRVQGGGDDPLLKAISAVVVYLAANPERRRAEPAVIDEALRDEYGEDLPVDLASWLVRQPSLTARTRHHGARSARRHFHSRPPVTPDGG